MTPRWTVSALYTHFYYCIWLLLKRRECLNVVVVIFKIICCSIKAAVTVENVPSGIHKAAHLAVMQRIPAAVYQLTCLYKFSYTGFPPDNCDRQRERILPSKMKIKCVSKLSGQTRSKSIYRLNWLLHRRKQTLQEVHASQWCRVMRVRNDLRISKIKLNYRHTRILQSTYCPF